MSKKGVSALEVHRQTGLSYKSCLFLLYRYLAEYEFRYNGRRLSDGERKVAAILASEGKRLRYRQPVDSCPDTKPSQLQPVF